MELPSAYIFFWGPYEPSHSQTSTSSEETKIHVGTVAKEVYLYTALPEELTVGFL